MVFESTPTLMPASRKAAHVGRRAGSVKVCGSQNSQYAVSSAGSCSSPASSNRSATVELCWWSRERPQIAVPARWSRSLETSTSWSALTTAWASARDSAWKSMSCHAVRVPPQSKMTASIDMGGNLRCRADSHPSGDHAREPGRLVERDEGSRTAELHERRVREGRQQSLGEVVLEERVLRRPAEQHRSLERLQPPRRLDELVRTPSLGERADVPAYGGLGQVGHDPRPALVGLQRAPDQPPEAQHAVPQERGPHRLEH